MNPDTYPARLEIDYPENLDRATTFLRPILIIPIFAILALITGSGETVVNTITVDEAGEVLSRTSESGGGLAAGIFAATALMIVFRQRYPRWWFDFTRELARFGNRVAAYFSLLTDQYPSTVEEQSVHLELDYPDVEADLNRWLPLFKWLLAIPHYIVLLFLYVAGFFVVLAAWFAILATGRYPRAFFNYVVGVQRYGLRVWAYAFAMVTDRYPPFSLA